MCLLENSAGNIDHDYISLKTYNGGDNESQPPTLGKQKLSQSSDEIAHTVNIFFEKKGGILDHLGSRNDQ